LSSFSVAGILLTQEWQRQTEEQQERNTTVQANAPAVIDEPKNHSIPHTQAAFDKARIASAYKVYLWELDIDAKPRSTKETKMINSNALVFR
jgi:hypothetical protein